jgi:histone-lysine N-methyltransferase SETD2
VPRLDGLRVGVSRIHGYGVFTTRAFRAGEVVVHADGVVYDEHAEFDDTYALVVPQDDDDPSAGLVFLDLADQTRWINHSCDPNTAVESTYDRATGELRAWWVAARDLAIGEELTYDYAFIGIAAEPCGCGAPGCRGLIVDPDPSELAQVAPELRAHLRIERSGAAA